MAVEATYFTAFIVGFLGGVHCLGMCGGIVGALTLGTRDRELGQWRLLLGYNLGRISSYTLIGAVAGFLGYLAADLSGLQSVRIAFQVIAAFMMIALGLYLAGWWQGVMRIEAIGARLWHKIEPLGRRFIPVHSFGSACILGLVWGWLPCGLIYSILLWALAAASPLEGAGLMLSFGLGTLPNLLVMGLFATKMTVWAQNILIKRTAGLVIISLAIYQLFKIV